MSHIDDAVRFLGMADRNESQRQPEGYLMKRAEVHATLALAEQQRIANKLLVAQIDQLTAMAQTMPGPGYPSDPSVRIREYLSEEEWMALGEGLQLAGLRRLT